MRTILDVGLQADLHAVPQGAFRHNSPNNKWVNFRSDVVISGFPILKQTSSIILKDTTLHPFICIYSLVRLSLLWQKNKHLFIYLLYQFSFDVVTLVDNCMMKRRIALLKSLLHICFQINLYRSSMLPKLNKMF